MCLTTLLLPGLMIYILYSFMGDALGSQLNVTEDFQPAIRAVEISDSMRELFAQAGMETEEIGADEQADAMNAVQQEEIDLLIVFPQDFDAAVRAYDVSAGEAAPNIEIYYNSASTDSSAAFEQVQGMLNQYESALSNCFDINRGQEGYDLADDRDLAGMTMASMMPLLILIFLFSGCMAVAPESIAGEKERGTIATILVTPIRRSELALGKIFSLSIIALLSGLSSTVGILLSMPKLMGGMEVNMTTAGAIDRDDSILDFCRLNDITIQTWSPFQYGFFEGVFIGSDKYPELNHCLEEIADKYRTTPTTIAAAWILRHPAHMQLIAGTTKPSRFREICAACDITLTREEWYRLYLAAGHILP